MKNGVENVKILLNGIFTQPFCIMIPMLVFLMTDFGSIRWKHGYWYHRPPMGGFGGWHRPPMHHHRPIGGFGGHMGGMHTGGFGGAFGGGGRIMGGGAGRGRH